jgi:hypothetical protein
VEQADHGGEAGRTPQTLENLGDDEPAGAEIVIAAEEMRDGLRGLRRLAIRLKTG